MPDDKLTCTDEMLSRQAVLDALNEQLPYPTEACAIIRAMRSTRPIPTGDEAMKERGASALQAAWSKNPANSAALLFDIALEASGLLTKLAEVERALREAQPYVRDTLARLSMPSQHFEIAKVKNLLAKIGKALGASDDQ